MVLTEDDFGQRTKTIHTWCHYGTVSTAALLAELRYWVTEMEKQQEALDFDGSPTTSQVASHGGDSPQRGIGGQGRAGTSPATHLDGESAGRNPDARA